ncbi:MAG: hypothetical protein EAZ85_12540 [Bacteroidetes bacterium]|nr:MAG: hypothetical protein EAZ85_12540 [Bacteroidota bacterium]
MKNKNIFCVLTTILIFSFVNINNIFAQIQTQDVQGEWVFDQMVIEGGGTKNERSEKFVEDYNKSSKDNLVIKYLPDGKFISQKSNQVNVEGSWSIVENKIKISTNYGDNFQDVKIDKNTKTLTLFVGGYDENATTKTMIIFKQK